MLGLLLLLVLAGGEADVLVQIFFTHVQVFDVHNELAAWRFIAREVELARCESNRSGVRVMRCREGEADFRILVSVSDPMSHRCPFDGMVTVHGTRGEEEKQ